MTTIEPTEAPGPISVAQDHRHVPTCACVLRHIAEAVRYFDDSSAVLESAKTADDPCDQLLLLKTAAELRLAGIREVRAADFGLHFDPTGATSRPAPAV